MAACMNHRRPTLDVSLSWVMDSRLPTDRGYLAPLGDVRRRLWWSIDTGRFHSEDAIARYVLVRVECRVQLLADANRADMH